MEKNGETPSQAVYPVFVKLQNPIDMEATADIDAWRRGLNEYGYTLEDLEAAGDIDLSGEVTNEDMFRGLEEIIIDEQIPMYEGAERVQDIMRAMGHDGVTHVGGGRVSADGVRHNVYIVFDPENIRSVNAAFDPQLADRPNILYARNQGQTAREEEANWDRRQKLILAGERAWGWQFMDALKAGRIQFTDKAGMVGYRRVR